MLRVPILGIATVLALASPTAASCAVVPTGGTAYPQGQEALLLCQQRALSEAVEDAALDEQLRALERELQRLKLEQQRLQMRPIEPFEMPRF